MWDSSAAKVSRYAGSSTTHIILTYDDDDECYTFARRAILCWVWWAASQPASPPHSLSLGLLLITARWTHSNRRRCIDPFHRRRRRPALYRVTFVVCRNCHHKSGSKVQQYVNNMHVGSSRMTLSSRLHKSQLNCAFYQHSTVKHSTDGLVRPISCPCDYRAPHLSRTMPSMWSNQFVFDS